MDRAMTAHPFNEPAASVEAVSGSAQNGLHAVHCIAIGVCEVVARRTREECNRLSPRIETGGRPHDRIYRDNAPCATRIGAAECIPKNARSLVVIASKRECRGADAGGVHDVATGGHGENIGGRSDHPSRLERINRAFDADRLPQRSRSRSAYDVA